jgi:hypothetical protein
MSLAILADHMASKGRGPDSMLVHMSPREVHGLQALAQKHGGTLTINPETGLPEAGFLDKLIPIIAGVALGPAGFGVMSAGMAGLTVGGIEALRTGDIGKGLAAGLGAYGGADLSATLAGPNSLYPTGAMESQIAADALAKAGLTGEAALTPEADLIASNAIQQQLPDKLANASALEKLGLGAKAAFSSPTAAGNFLASNWKPLAAALSPIVADQMVKSNMPQTTTYHPNIRRYIVDPNAGRAYFAGEYDPTKRAADGGLMGLANGGQFDWVGKGEPVVRMADGGTPTYTDAQVASYIQNNALSGQALQDAADVFGVSADQISRAQSLLSANDASVAAATNAYNAEIAAHPEYAAQNAAYYDPATHTGTGWEDVSINRWIQDNPSATYGQMSSAAQGAGITNEDIQRAFDRYGYSGADFLVATDPNWQNQLGISGLAGLNSNINRWIDNANASSYTPAEIRARAYQDLAASGMNEKDVLRATGKTIEELFPDKKTITTVTPGGTKLDTATTYDNGAYGNYGSGNVTGIDYKGNPVSIATPGDIITNPDLTRTVVPNIPGRPYGGFTGIEALKSAYTAGGGSLGYTPYVPTSIADFNAKYNKLTPSGSKQAYEHLMGLAPYSPTPWTPTGEVMKPYSEAVLGMPADISSKRYIFDPDTRALKLNPDYIPVSYTSEGKKVYGLSANDIKAQLPGVATSDYEKWMQDNNVTFEQIAQATGKTVADVKKGNPLSTEVTQSNFDYAAYLAANPDVQAELDKGVADFGTKDDLAAAAWNHYIKYGKAEGRQATMKAAGGGLMALAGGGAAQYDLGGYSDGGRLLRGPGDGVSDSIPATIGNKRPARLANNEFVIPARIVSELGNGSTDAGAKKLYAMMDRVQNARKKSIGKNKIAVDTKADKFLPA